MPQATRPEPTHEQHSESDQSQERLLTAEDAAARLRLSPSWLAKARMRGDGPPFVKLGRSVRYGESALAKWTRSHTRNSTSER
jgi:predicted DNA-binding transcriptional regulator AlpA